MQMTMRRSSAYWDMAALIGEKVIDVTALQDFSQDLQDAVRLISRIDTIETIRGRVRYE